MAILAVPARAAQGVADILAKVGVSSILNFAPVRVKVRPPAPSILRNRPVPSSTRLSLSLGRASLGSSAVPSAKSFEAFFVIGVLSICLDRDRIT